MKNLLIFLVIAVSISAIIAKPMKLNKVAQQLRDLGDEDNNDDNDNDGDWGQGEEESDVVAFLVVAEPNGYAFDVNVLAAPVEEEYEDSGDDDIDWYNYDGGNDEDNGNGDENKIRGGYNGDSEKWLWYPNPPS